MIIRLFITTVFIVHVFVEVNGNNEKDENAGRIFMENLNKIKAEENNKGTLASWAYDSNITDETLQLQVRYIVNICFENYLLNYIITRDCLYFI